MEKLNNAPEAQTQEQKECKELSCSKCLRTIKSFMNFCPYCGQKLKINKSDNKSYSASDSL